MTDEEIHRLLSECLPGRDPDTPSTVLGAGSDDLGVGRRYLEALVEGGFPQAGFLAADGGEEIRLTYDFNSTVFVNRASGNKEDIVGVELRLVLGNDYQVWMTSDLSLIHI